MPTTSYAHWNGGKVKYPLVVTWKFRMEIFGDAMV